MGGPEKDCNLDVTQQDSSRVQDSVEFDVKDGIKTLLARELALRNIGFRVEGFGFRL